MDDVVDGVRVRSSDGGMTIPTSEFPRDRHGLIRRARALDLGISDDRLAAAVKHGELLRVAPGAFTVPPVPDPAAPWRAEQETYRLACIAAATAGHAGELPLSHQSAAAVHGLPLLDPDRSRVHVTLPGAAGGSLRPGRHRHTGPLAADEVVVVDGVPVTSLRRTVADIARTGTFAQALTAVDGGLRRGLTKDELRAALDGRATTGVRTARSAVRYGDRLSESVGESWSRAQMIGAGLPLPTLQRVYVLDGAEFRVDFDWEGRLVGEFDGLIKYRGVLRPGEAPHEAVIREKRRDLALRNAGLEVAHWIWRELRREQLVPVLRSWLARVGILAG